jgi:hypothetical protein
VEVIVPAVELYIARIQRGQVEKCIYPAGFYPVQSESESEEVKPCVAKHEQS